MELTKKQEEALLNRSRYKVLNWGRRSGKTTLFAYEALGTAIQKNAQVTYYAQTFGDARDIAWDIFLEVFGNAVISKNQSLLEIKLRNRKGGTSTVSLKGWESVYTSGKGRGTSNDLILADEVAFCRGFLEHWDKVLAPTLLTTKGRAVFGSTPNGFNDFYELTVRATNSKDWWYCHATSYDNEHNDPAEIDRIKSEIPEDRFAQEYLADFRKMEGLVYKEFLRQAHTYDKKEVSHIARYAGVDFGYRHAAAALTILKDKYGNYYVESEWYKTGKTDAEIAEYVASQEFNIVYPDPENQGAIKELQNRGVNCHEVIKNKGSVKNGISKVRELLKQGRLKVHVSCVNLIYEFETYAYPDSDGSRTPQEDPLKENDHALDALRYCIMMQETEKQIQHYTSYQLSERDYSNVAV